MKKGEMQMKEEKEELHSLSLEMLKDFKKENRFLKIANLFQAIAIVILILSIILR